MTLIMGAMSLSVVNAARVPLTYDDPLISIKNETPDQTSGVSLFEVYYANESFISVPEKQVCFRIFCLYNSLYTPF